MMEHKEMIERIAAGLRAIHGGALSCKPEGLIYFDDGGAPFDVDMVCGVRILRSADAVLFTDDRDCPFLPVWTDRRDYTWLFMAMYDFRKAFQEYDYGRKG